MTIDGELSVRSMFSGPIIDKLVYSIKKNHNKYYMYVEAHVEWSMICLYYVLFYIQIIYLFEF